MDAEQIRQLKPMLNKYLGQFEESFGRIDTVRHLETYVRGQLSDLPRKSIEPMADASGVPPRTLQEFLSLLSWDELSMRDTLQQVVSRDHAHGCSIGIIDETGHPKKGDKTPGVQRQWCGNTGKIDNCVVTVHLCYACDRIASGAGSFHCLLDSELFLPERWADDGERCRQAGIPDEMVHRPKWKIALELYERAIANQVRFSWLTFDEQYGQIPEFLFRLDDRGQLYVGEIPNGFTGWLIKPSVLRKDHHKTTRKGKLKVKSSPAVTVKNLLRFSYPLRDQPWEKFYIKDTTKGPMVWEAKATRFYLNRDGQPTFPHWLIVARNVLDPTEIKFFISNAPADIPLEVLLHVGFSRWHVERCFEDEKGEVGLSHFEVRNYRSLRRHLILTAVSFLFLAKVHQIWWGKKSGTDRLPSPNGQLRPDPIALENRTRPKDGPDILGTSGQIHHPHATPKRQSPKMPHQSPTAVTAAIGHPSVKNPLLHL
jgi:SRSO17 transposase